MRTMMALKAVAVVLSAVVLGLLAVQGSYALWGRMVPANAGTIRAADFRVTLTDLATGAPVEMTDAQGNSANVVLSASSGALLPGSSVYAGVRISNVTNAGSFFTIRTSLGSVTKTSPGSQTLASQLTVAAQAVAPTAAQCPAQTYSAAPSGITLDIAKGASAAICFQITLAAAAPSSLQGQTAQVSIPVTVHQL